MNRYGWAWLPEVCHWTLLAIGAQADCEHALTKAGKLGVVNGVAGEVGEIAEPETFGASRVVMQRLESGGPVGIDLRGRLEQQIIESLIEHKYARDPAWFVAWSGDRRTVWLERQWK